MRAESEPSGAANRPNEEHDNPLERLELLAGDDTAIESFLDEIDVHSPREREMLTELARTKTISRPERLVADHTRAIAALESLRRHGFHGSRAASRVGSLKTIARWGVQLVARYIVVSHTRSIARNMRDLYWLREMESADGSDEHRLVRPLRIDAEALVQITRTREIGIPAFVIGGLLIPLAASVYRLTTGTTFDNWRNAVIVGVIGAAIGITISWFLLRGTAMASRRIRLSTREPLRALWTSIGYCGQPPKEQSRRFAIVGIALTVGAWIVIPTLVGLSFVT